MLLDIIFKIVKIIVIILLAAGIFYMITGTGGIIVPIFLALGIFFMIIASVGFLRFPDFYTRLHSTGKCDTLGQILIILGLIFYQGFTLLSVKLLFLIFFILLANPVGTHAMMKAAYVTGVKPWMKGEKRR